MQIRKGMNFIKFTCYFNLRQVLYKKRDMDCCLDTLPLLLRMARILADIFTGFYFNIMSALDMWIYLHGYKF